MGTVNKTVCKSWAITGLAAEEVVIFEWIQTLE